ncbi:dihydrodipicolinate synthase family protein [Mucilaginibacter daejeonensis]|uniref:dihydrodipicolinate synthase family protein n=1 Tax=Mucilaginibacter daejeonensis TaxID=398049 RepID=UPI001D175391|nr:dihydrodipicolinate synthase family protein [Mucilaginibacter daejeonensis]UEG52854.1 dihydrodipicolinate synthase family protein [Mucilaginibacter daejeonensis]
MTTDNAHKKGFIPVMLTPFTDTGAVDHHALASLTDFYLRSGVAGLFANCLSSEMFELSDEERLQVIRQVVKVADGKVPVVATGTFGGPIEDQADFIKEVYDTGVQAVIGITGLIAGQDETDAVFNRRIDQLLELTDEVPLGFYECPVPYKRLLSAEQLHQFASTGRVIYHKDTCLDIDQVRAKVDATDSFQAFGLYDAYMVHAVESLKAGAKGLSCIQGNYFPELIVWLCDHYNDPALSVEVNKVQQFFIDHMDVMHHVYPTVSKYYLQKRGVNISTYTRRDVGSFTSEVRNSIDQLFEDHKILQQELEITSVS